MTILETQGLAARHAERVLAVAGTAQKNRALEAMARALKERESAILAENQKDLAAARESGMKASLLYRLALSPQRIDGIVEGVRQVAALPDPIGTVEGHITLWPQRHGTDGFYICRMTRKE